MPGRFYRNVLLTCVMAVLVASCGKQSERARAARAAQTDIPPTLQKIAQRAEAIIAIAPTGDWPRIYAYSRDIKDAWLDYKHPTISTWSARFRPPGAIFVQELDAAVAALYDAGAARDPTRTMKAANDISAAALDLFEYYHPTDGPDMRRLAVLQRRVLIDSAAGDLNSASKTLSNLDQMWQRVRPSVETRTDAEVVQALQDNIAAQRAALATGDRAALTASAQDTLSLIDQMR